MKNKKFITLFPLALLFINCNNDSSNVTDPISESKISTLKDYQDFLNTETTGALLIQSFETNNSTTGATYSTAASIKGNREPLTLNIDNTIISFNNFYYSKSANKSFSNLYNLKLGEVYGKTFKVELMNNNINLLAKTGSNTTSEIESAYIPELIHPVFSKLKNGDTVINGTQITWNTDPKNTKGVVINMDFDPSIQSTEIRNNYPNRMARPLTLVDNGSYSFTANFNSEYLFTNEQWDYEVYDFDTFDPNDLVCSGSFNPLQDGVDGKIIIFNGGVEIQFPYKRKLLK
jgi:hypothetical protein